MLVFYPMACVLKLKTLDRVGAWCHIFRKGTYRLLGRLVLAADDIGSSILGIFWVVAVSPQLTSLSKWVRGCKRRES